MVVLNHTVKDIQGQEVNLADYRGQVLLLVNVASECGYTKQYKPLQALYARYQEAGFKVLAFPCNDFGAQEPGDEATIAQFCVANFGVSFPLFAKVNIRTEPIEALYQEIQAQGGPGVEGDVRWNFTKFLVDKQGAVVARFEPSVDPLDEALTSQIEALLAQG